MKLVHNKLNIPGKQTSTLNGVYRVGDFFSSFFVNQKDQIYLI